MSEHKERLKMKRALTTTKSFLYEKGGAKLDFSLRVDIKNELTAFEAILIEALEDVRAELKDGRSEPTKEEDKGPDRGSTRLVSEDSADL